MTAHKIFGAILVCATAAATLPACVHTGPPYVSSTSPPPPREEIVVAKPGYIWVNGHWDRGFDTWHWRPGYYERIRVGQRFVNGHWERTGNVNVYVEGAWRST